MSTLKIISKGTFKLLTCDEPSPRTGRTYPLEEMKKAVEKYKKKFLENGVGYGEINAPGLVLDITSISHRVTDISFEGNELLADVEVLDTPDGKMLNEMLTSKVSMRLTPVMTAQIDKEDLKVTDIEMFKTSFLDDDYS